MLAAVMRTRVGSTMLAAVMRTRVGGTVGLHVKTEDSVDEVYLRIQATVASSMHLFL